MNKQQTNLFIKRLYECGVEEIFFKRIPMKRIITNNDIDDTRIAYLENEYLITENSEKARNGEKKHFDAYVLFSETTLRAICEYLPLKVLDVARCNLSQTSLPLELANLINLHKLDLSSNKIDFLPKEIFGLHHLTDLDISSCGLTLLSPQIGDLSNLRNLSTSENEILSLPNELFKLRNLAHLDIHSCNLDSLPSEINHLENLTKLNVRNNKILSLPDELFELSTLRDLDLSGCGSSSLPEKLFNLTNLEKLGLGYFKLSSLPNDLFRLNNLKKLDIHFNKFTFVPEELFQFAELSELDASFNQIRTLPSEIFRLFNLTRLNLTHNKLSSLPLELFQLTNLEDLTVPNCDIASLPSEIGNLIHLVSLDISFNKIKSLPASIGKLSKLMFLSITRNQLTNLPREIFRLINLNNLSVGQNNLSFIPSEIGDLKNLWHLDFDNNQISELPNGIQKLEKLLTLDLQKNPLPIPPEILEKNNDPQAILSYYFSIKAGNKRAINETKILIIGQGSVGKTSLIERILQGSFNLNQLKTEGISISQWQIERNRNDEPNSHIHLNIWDFGGQEIMHATHQFFLTKRSLYLLVLDSRLTQEENRVEYWLKIIQSFSDESPVLIVGNKIDQHPLDIDRTGLQKKYPNIVGILETSAATGTGIGVLKAAIAEQVNNLPHVRDLLPETWFTVKTKLEGLGRESNFITHDKYLELCAENEVSDETSQRTLIGFLHDLGVVLHFQDDRRLAELGILNPQWVTNGVYKILNDKALFANKGVLTLPLLDQILSTPEYPQNKRLFIVDMMKKFELCYDIDRDNFLIPDLLPKDEPELKFNGVPAFEYAYPVLPSSVITRFIVRMNQKIDDGFVWRTGVVLKIGENKALVKADIEDRKITIAIDGVEHTRRDALSAIRYQLDEIHGSIKGLDAQKRVPIPEAPNADPLDYDYLLQLERDGELEILPVKDGSRLVKVNVRKLLGGVVSETERRQSAGNTTNIYIGGDVKDSNILAGDENEVNK